MTMFQQRHFEAIAQLFQDIKRTRLLENDGPTIVSCIEYDFAMLFKRDNPRFNTERFRAACQPGANVKARTRYKVVA